MHNLVFRQLVNLRENYWFWPSMMTLLAVVLGFVLPYLDILLGPGWIQAVGFLRPTDVDGARAILTTMAGATLGVAGVAFSVTIVAVSFASGNYGPRLISNFMGDKENQIVLGIFVATFVYCITVLSTVHTGANGGIGTAEDPFVPQTSVFFAMLLTLASVGALIAYIHHVPESINIMNLTAKIGHNLQSAIIKMQEKESACPDDGQQDVEAWRNPPRDGDEIIFANAAGYLQQFDLESLVALARAHKTQITLHRAPGDFLVTGEIIMSAGMLRSADGSFAGKLLHCYSQGTNRTDLQDVLFLSDQLVEVLGRALSTGINDPHTAVLCLNWLKSGLVEFARRPPAQAARKSDPVLYRRVSFQDMLDRSFDQMRQSIATDRTVTIHALRVLADIAEVASRGAMVVACVDQMHRLVQSAKESLEESVAHAEIDVALGKALAKAAGS